MTLDDLDSDQRAARRRQLDEWRRIRKAEVVRAKHVLENPSSTPEAKRDAKILIGAYAVDPFLMVASGSGMDAHHGSQGMTAPANRHPKTPLPPSGPGFFRRLRERLRRGTNHAGRRS
jgi:hypothetical protein